MGNYCCEVQEKNQTHSPLKIKKKASLRDPEAKKKYQQNIGSILNTALGKYKEKKIVTGIQIKGVLGRGGQGAVFLIEMACKNKLGETYIKEYAMKRIFKKKLDISRVRQALLLENYILSSHSSPFLAEIQYGFEDHSYLYYVMQLAKGGDFYSFLVPDSLKRSFMESKFLEVVKFVLAGIIIGLEYLHRMEVIYLDLKPQNILIYSDGYPKLADFGIAVSQKQNSGEKCFRGTAIYSAPEMVRKQKFGRSADLWSLGIMTYELLTGKTPFSHKLVNSKYFERAIDDFEYNPTFGSSNIPEQSKQFISSLLKKDPSSRLGYKSFEDLKSHSFFAGFDWQNYEAKNLSSPLREAVSDISETNQISRESLEDLIQTDVLQRLSITFVRETSQTQSSSDQKSPVNGFYESEDEEEIQRISIF